MTAVDTVIAELKQFRTSATDEFIRCINSDLQAALAYLNAGVLPTNAPDATIISNISGAPALPIPNTLSAILDYILGSAQGDIIYRGATGWAALPPGTSGQFLETLGAAMNPAWANPGPSSLAAIASLTILANITGAPAAPAADGLSAIIDACISNVQGDILYRSATGWVALPPGTAGNVLTTGGAAANPAWAAPSSGGPVKLATITASGSPTFISDTTHISASYNSYWLILRNLIPTAAAGGLFQFSNNAGSSYLTTGYNNPATATGLNIMDLVTSIAENASIIVSNISSTVTNGGVSGTLLLTNPNNAAGGCGLSGILTCIQSATTCVGIVAGNNTTAAAVNAWQFSFPTTTIKSGSIDFWGIPT